MVLMITTTAFALLCGAALGVFVAAVCLGVCVLYATLWHLARGVPANTRVVPLESVNWRTGDIVITTHYNDDFSDVVKKRMPNHAGLVWVHPDHGTCIVETGYLPFASTNEPVCVIANACTFDGTRVTKLADYVRAYPYLCLYHRPYLGPCISSTDFAVVVNAAMLVPFEPLLSSKIHAGFYVGVGMISMAPPFGHVGKMLVGTARSNAAMSNTNTNTNALQGVICSELIVQMLQALGVIDSDADAMLTPTGLASPSGCLDRIAGGKWGTEHRVTTRHETHPP